MDKKKRSIALLFYADLFEFRGKPLLHRLLWGIPVWHLLRCHHWLCWRVAIRHLLWRHWLHLWCYLLYGYWHHRGWWRIAIRQWRGCITIRHLLSWHHGLLWITHRLNKLTIGTEAWIWVLHYWLHLWI